MIRGPVPRRLVGDAGPSVWPGADPALYGSVSLAPTAPVEARSHQTFTLTYTVGRLGLDDSGAIRVGFRLVGDSGTPQMTQPEAANYTTARCSGGGRILLGFDRNGPRPWNKTLTARLEGGFLREGDTVTIIFGDTSGGAPGLAMPTYAEEGLEFRVAVDVCATGHFLPLPEVASVPVVAGPPVRWKAVLPTLRRPGEAFRLGLKAEDLWGNPTAQARAELTLEPSLPVDGLPEALDYGPGERARSLDGLTVAQEGILRIVVRAGGEPVAEAGPLVVRDGATASFWGDLHGQTSETVGVNSAESYFEFARDLAFLDATSHQGNDFQINAAFWTHLNALTARHDAPGRFVALPGYEWSGNTAVGGDHNVFFRTEGRPIRRSSHALLTDRSDADTDALDLKALFRALQDEDCVVYAHVGGRYADIAYAHDPRLETALELHSAWGTFEWLLLDAFRLGYRCGVVCNSDGHKGRPGASYPGSSTFGAYGGLTCFVTDRLDRDAIMACQRRRHHYGTTGCRLHLEVEAAVEGTLFERDPAAGEVPGRPTQGAVMGDIVRATADAADLRLRVVAPAPVERVEIRRGAETLETVRPYAAADLGQRVRVVWQGAEYRGRGRDTAWRGRARFSGARLARLARINAWNPERLFEQRGSDTVLWDAVTTGNFMAFDAWLSDVADDARLAVTTNHGDLDVPLAEIGLEDVVLDAGGLGRRLRAFRLPETNPHRDMTIERRIPLLPEGDTPLWVCVTTEDGHQAWSSPIYLIR